MPSKKKPKLLFEVPAETEPSAQSGWVYRSEPDVPEKPRPETARHKPERPKPERHQPDRHQEADTSPDWTVLSVSAAAVALSMAAIVQTLAFSAAVATIPCAAAIRAFRWLAKPGDSAIR